MGLRRGAWRPPLQSSPRTYPAGRSILRTQRAKIMGALAKSQLARDLGQLAAMLTREINLDQKPLSPTAKKAVQVRN